MLLCVVGVSVWSWSALQFVLQDLKIALANTPSVHPLFVLYCVVYYKSACVCQKHCYRKATIWYQWYHGNWETVGSEPNPRLSLKEQLKGLIVV